MNDRIDDVRLTAYALGELEPAEASEIEALLATNEDARREVDRIRAFAGTLAEDLGREPAPRLTGAQRADIAAAADAPAPTLANRHPEDRPRWYSRPWTIAAAASILVVVTSAIIGSQHRGLWDATRSERGAGEVRRSVGGVVAPEQDIRLLDAGEEIQEQTKAVYHLRVPVAALELKKAPAQQPASDPAQNPAFLAFSRDDDGSNGEAYAAFAENAFVRALGDDSRSTFALDVDTASYSNVRRLLRQGVRPDKGAVRIEEMINYFDYDYPAPEGGQPLGVTVEVAACPWAPAHRLALIGLRAKSVERGERRRANLVFLIDVSGSMAPENKLPLVKKALRMLLPRLQADDRVALAVYAGSSGLVLPSTPARDRGVLEDAIERLDAGGSTNGGQGIELAYAVAKENFVDGGINRVILCTDGDFNVGVTSESALVELIEAKAKTGVFLTALGFGMGNLKDSTLQKLANKGNGNYGYVDGEMEAKKLLVDQVDGTLVTVAKDARIQVEFNPDKVGAWRLIGYEKRVMANRDFHDDKKDAGEVGAGHTVTALYEIIPAGSPELENLPKADPLKYQGAAASGSAQRSADLMTVALRWKPADGDKSTLSETRVPDDGGGAAASRNLRWAAAVAMFGMELRGSEHKGLTSWALVDELAGEAKGADARGLRAELLELIALARKITAPQK
jgi:Ca-activated chloride channel family protein